jgi:ATP-dependent helicase/nuclease subunit B
MSVTQFRDYLACPFRFYLRHVLGMEELGDEKREMDALDFGSLIHCVLQKMAGSDEMRCCENEVKLHDFLYAEAERWVAKRFGPSPPLMVGVQLDSAKQRLAAAARVQAGLVGEGWEILRSEMEISRKLTDMLVRGRIDRIDRHRETGLIRLLDYKTSDRIQSPEQAHFASLAEHAAEYMKVAVNGAERRWIDLQLPLYRFLLPDGEEFRGEVELGYFNLPKSVNDTGVIIWDGFCDELLQSAVSCAVGVVGDIRNRRFWPPATKVSYDDFETLFRPDVSGCIDIAAFTSFMKRGVQ